MHVPAGSIGLVLVLAVACGPAAAEQPPAAPPANGPASADREQLPLFITGEHWKRWGEIERVLYLKGFVEAYHSQARPYVARPDIQTIADLDRAISAFYARHPEAWRVEVNALAAALLGSTLDLESVATLARPGGGIREESVPSLSPPPSRPPDY